jgi:hypothetical protein
VKNKHIQMTSIATLVAICAWGIPTPTYGELDLADVNEFAASDSNRLTGAVMRAVVQKSPWVDVLEGGIMEANVSTVQKVVVQERAVLNQSLVQPVSYADTDACGTLGPAMEVGSTEFSFQLGTIPGKGPLVCVKGMRDTFKTAYSEAERSMKSELIQLNNADVRYNVMFNSGCKMTIKAGADFSTMFDGGINALATPYPDAGDGYAIPNGAPNMALLKRLGAFLKEVLLVDPFEVKGGDSVFRFIGDQALVDYVRDDADVKSDQRYIAAGSYGTGKDALLRYEWEGPYRGWSFGTDPVPLRYNTVTNGVPNYIEPLIEVEVDNKVAARPNPLGKRSFKKLAPQAYTGEGGFKFPAQGTLGDLVWYNERTEANIWQDFGRHYYRFIRAYMPVQPHAVIAIAYARQNEGFSISAITNFGDWSSSSSL